MSEPKKHESFLWAKICVGIIGIILSIVFHEMFHIAMHWNDIQGHGLFSKHGAVVELFVWAPQGYDLEGEEMFAYAITLMTLLVTIMIIYRIHDATDDRSAAQILFPNDKEMHKIPPAELLSMAEITASDILPMRPIVQQTTSTLVKSSKTVIEKPTEQAQKPKPKSTASTPTKKPRKKRPTSSRKARRN